MDGNKNNEDKKPDPPERPESDFADLEINTTESGNFEVRQGDSDINSPNSYTEKEPGFQDDIDVADYFEYMKSPSNSQEHFKKNNVPILSPTKSTSSSPPTNKKQPNGKDSDDDYEVGTGGKLTNQFQLKPGMMMVPTQQLSTTSLKHEQSLDNMTNQSIDPSTSFANNPSTRSHHSIQSTLLVRHITRVAMFHHTDKDENSDTMSPALKRRLRDFRFAQRKRRDKYGEHHPWGIIGLYDHLSGIRTDIEWAEDAAWRRENEQPYLSWQDFEEAKDTGFNQPFFTYFTMLVCTVCLVISIGLNGWSFDSLKNNPMIGPPASVLVQMGAKYTPKIVNDNEWYRIFTAMFLHAGIIHFVVNMLALWFIGSAVEQSHGFFAAALLFILPAIGGTLLSALFLPEYISVGASGGIFGLIGACLADIISNWGLLFSKYVNDNNESQRFRHVKVLIWLVVDILVNIIIGLTPFVDNFTHVGGMFFGFFCGLSTMERLSKAFFGVKTHWFSRFQTFLVRFFGIIFSSICIVIAFILLLSLQNGSEFQCHGCRYISCVPFPFWETTSKWWYCDDCNKPIVKAQLYQDRTSLVYTHMDLTCPDNSTVFNITLHDKHTNKDLLKSQLSDFCRDECDVLFSN